MNRGRNGKKDVRLFLRPGKPGKANNLIINSLWIVFYVEWHQLPVFYVEWHQLLIGCLLLPAMQNIVYDKKQVANFQ